MKKIIITIDGHSACGKSTLARALAQELDYGYIDTGAMYRAVTYFFLENRVNIQKTSELERALPKINITFKSTVMGNRTFLNGQDIEDTIRKMFVSKNVSHVAAISAVRRMVVKQQKEMGRRKGIVMEGRDIGTVVFPNAKLKIFLTADEDVRAKRRFDEIKKKGQNTSLKAIKQNLLERDHIDSTRKDSPLKKAKEAILIDNSNLTLREQLHMVLALAKERIRQENVVAKKATDKKAPAKKTSTPAKSNTRKSTQKASSSNNQQKGSRPNQKRTPSNQKSSNNNTNKKSSPAPQKATKASNSNSRNKKKNTTQKANPVTNQKKTGATQQKKSKPNNTKTTKKNSTQQPVESTIQKNTKPAPKKKPNNSRATKSNSTKTTTNKKNTSSNTQKATKPRSTKVTQKSTSNQKKNNPTPKKKSTNATALKKQPSQKTDSKPNTKKNSTKATLRKQQPSKSNSTKSAVKNKKTTPPKKTNKKPVTTKK